MATQQKLHDILYEVEWVTQDLVADVRATASSSSSTVNDTGQSTVSKYLGMTAGMITPVQPDTYMSQYKIGERASYVDDLELLARSYAIVALERLGWLRVQGNKVVAENLRHELGVAADYRFMLLQRLLVMLSEAGILTPLTDGEYLVAAGADTYQHNPETLAQQLEIEHGQDAIELALLRRCGGKLADVLRGQAEPLPLLFPDQGLGVADLYVDSPAIQAAHSLVRDTIALIVKNMPEDQQIRVLEIGTGISMATNWILSALPADGFHYTFADISTDSFPATEEAFNADEHIDYRTLDTAKDPVAQGFAMHSYDLIVAPSILHTENGLHAQLVHCRQLLAPAGHLLAVERVRNRGWADLTFGLLDGWWHDDQQMASTAQTTVGLPEGDGLSALELVVINAQAPPKEKDTPAGCWVLVADRSGKALELARELTQHNHKVVLLGDEIQDKQNSADISYMSIDIESRAAWHSFFASLPADETPLLGVVHLIALDGHGVQATTKEMKHRTKRVGTSALALIQGLLEAGLAPAQGISFITRGAQVLEHERLGELTGALLWGLGKVIACEAKQLKPRLIDLDPRQAWQDTEQRDTSQISYLAAELLSSNIDEHVAYRAGKRKVARLARLDANKSRLTLPQNTNWRLRADLSGTLAGLRVEPVPDRKLGTDEVRIAVDAASINAKDVKASLGFAGVGDPIGCDACGQVIEVGAEVTSVAVGDRVVTLGRIPLGKFASETVSHQSLVMPVPPSLPTEALAAVPLCFTTAASSLRRAQLTAGERILIHAATGGVGQAAIQLAHALGVEVYATTAKSKQDYLRSLGVAHVFDSRQTRFGEEIFAATDGKGVQAVLNSLAGDESIEASLLCLGKGGRFVEIGSINIWSAERMTKARPDVDYTIIKAVGEQGSELEQTQVQFKDVMQRVCNGELKPPDYSLWSFTETRKAMEFMYTGQHVGKLVLTMPPLRNGKLRADRAYLVTEGLGTAGLAMAEWLADKGAGAIVLNGRKPPDTATNAKLAALRQRGVQVKIELADISDTMAVEKMLTSIDACMPPLVGVIHGVEELHTAEKLAQQSLEKFAQVLSAKISGAWNLHQATHNLEMFVLFTGSAGTTDTCKQASNAATDAFLHQLVAHRRAIGLPGMAVAWDDRLNAGNRIDTFAYLLEQNLSSVVIANG